MIFDSETMRAMLESCRGDIERAAAAIDGVHEGAMMLRVSMRAAGASGPPFVIECDERCHGFALAPMTLDEIRWRAMDGDGA